MAARQTQYAIEVLAVNAGAPVRISQQIVEALAARPTPAFTEITGAGVSQHVIEVLGAVAAPAVVTHHIVEVLCVQPDVSPPVGAVTRGWVSVH
jgi:hypothetical protein